MGANEQLDDDTRVRAGTGRRRRPAPAAGDKGGTRVRCVGAGRPTLGQPGAVRRTQVGAGPVRVRQMRTVRRRLRSAQAGAMTFCRAERKDGLGDRDRVGNAGQARGRAAFVSTGCPEVARSSGAGTGRARKRRPATGARAADGARRACAWPGGWVEAQSSLRWRAWQPCRREREQAPARACVGDAASPKAPALPTEGAGPGGLVWGCKPRARTPTTCVETVRNHTDAQGSPWVRAPSRRASWCGRGNRRGARGLPRRRRRRAFDCRRRGARSACAAEQAPGA